ncbi:MAG: hypothetical protein KJ043_17480, partial [Anaerolineae bacterium]|nr:hypothetical protein [Anaerolineae bacterium]
IIACLPGSMSDDLRKNISKSRYGLALDANTATNTPFNARVPRKLQEAELPVGRSFLILSGRVSILQVATPYPVVEIGAMGEPLDVEEQVVTMLDEWVSEIRTTWADTPAWAFPPLSEEEIQASASNSSNGYGGGTSSTPKPTPAPVVVAPAPIDLVFGEPLHDRIKEMIGKQYEEMYAGDEAMVKAAVQTLDGMGELALISQAIGDFDMLPVFEELKVDVKAVAIALIQNEFPPERLARKLKLNLDELKQAVAEQPVTETEGGDNS